MTKVTKKDLTQFIETINIPCLGPYAPEIITAAMKSKNPKFMNWVADKVEKYAFCVSSPHNNNTKEDKQIIMENYKTLVYELFVRRIQFT